MRRIERHETPEELSLIETLSAEQFKLVDIFDDFDIEYIGIAVENVVVDV